MSNILNAATFPLWGSRLIEASAGTGKTWTIAALYLRLVLGHGGEHAHARPLRPAEILVMTFTRAATRELSDRIRARLLEAARCFRGQASPEAHDILLTGLIDAYPAGTERSNAAWRLDLAAQSMDDASVHTIDAWCQRILREHAFDSGCLFDEELIADEKQLLTQACQDYWRQQLYPLAAGELEVALNVWASVQALVDDVRELREQPVPKAAGQGTLAQCVQAQSEEHRDAVRVLSAGWDKRSQAMQAWLDAQTAPKVCDWDKRKLAPRYYTDWLNTLSRWARDPEAGPLELSEPASHRLSPAGLLEARKDDTPPVDLPDHFQAFADLMQAYAALPQASVALRLHAVARVAERTAEQKRQAGTFGFSDMLQRLDQALSGANGPALRERMLAQYPVAMIDEFQDTSPLQYSIFNQLYRTADNDALTALLLIGDPKQSIYGFRGADIYSYLQARRATSGRHYVLGTNHRSTQALVGAVNQWFERGEGVRAEGAFMFRAGQANPLPFVPVAARGRAERFCTKVGAVPALSIHHDLNLRSNRESRQWFAARCAEQIVVWLNDAKAGFEEDDKPFRRLRPADIAVLVRTGQEAAAIRRELRRRAVASVYLSDKDSVFVSDEASDLLHWLRAVASPLDARLVRVALATRTLGLSLEELAWLAASDEAFDARSDQLRKLHAVWQEQGVLTMLRQTLHLLDLPVRWLTQPDGERRMTNFLHLAELLQTASVGADGEQALIRWLEAQMQGQSSSDDEQIVRLESDADLVKVITVHKSKGLEYPVVCLPFACSYRAMDRRTTRFVKLADDDGQRHLRLQYNSDELALADRDRLREDIRLLYVALTRARHALWLGFAALKVGNGKECKTHLSATGYLLAGPDPMAPSAYLVQLQNLAQSHSGIQLFETQEDVPRTPLARRDKAVALLPQTPYLAQFDRRWAIGSFSSMVRALASPSATLSPTRVLRSADDELPEFSEPASLALPAPSNATGLVSVWHGFIRGAQAGNFLHEQLEWLAGEGFALADNEPLAERLKKRCAHAGRGEQAEQVVQWLREVVRTPLVGPNVSLWEIQNLLPEMEFWLPADHLQAARVDALCRQHLLPGSDRPVLPERELHGMLMGFADLVFEHEGRYWVLDYKSNHLGEDGQAYHRDALQAAMAEHRYDVQAALYLLALHRLLRARLGDAYRPASQLGGAIYLFLRGIDGPQQGVYSVPPSLKLLIELDAMLSSEEQPA